MAEGQAETFDPKVEIGDVRSVSSRTSKLSNSSSATLAVFKARAKAEAAQARAAYAKREIELKVEQARLQATLDALQEEKGKDAAIAEAQTLEAALMETDCSAASRVSVPIPAENSLQRTADYVRAQSSADSGLRLSNERNGDEQPPFLTPHVISSTQAESPSLQSFPINLQSTGNGIRTPRRDAKL